MSDDSWDDWNEEWAVQPRQYLDPFEVIGEIPDGLAYQWVALKILGSAKAAQPQIDQMKRGGWMPVPSDRHPQMPHQGIWIIINDQLLVQKPKRLVYAEQDRLNVQARAMVNPQHTGRLFTADDVEIAKQKLKIFDGRAYAEFTITMGLALSDREIEAALYLDLDPSEYARRRIMMISQESYPAVLHSTGRGGYGDVPRFELLSISVKEH